MNFFTLAVIITLLVVAAGAGLMFLVVSFANAVKTNELVIEANEQLQKSVNPRQTAGHAIAVKADYEGQLEDARLAAAKRAAALPRGGNMGIGRLATTDARKNKKVASKGVEVDPISAVKIAKFHTWNGLQVVKRAATATVARAGGNTKQVKRKLKPGVDFEWKDIGGLTGADKRRVIIANAKSKSAAYKALKASGQDMMVVADGAPATGGVAAPAAPRIELPPAPTLIKITDDMQPAEIRKARIANSKAKSAYNKQLKALDINPKEVEWTDDGPKLPDTAQAAVAAAQAAAPPTAQPGTSAAPASTTPNSITLPEISGYTVITADMEAADLRKARIANAKAKSAYNKQLKASGIDPKIVKWTDSGPTLKQQEAPAPVAPAPTTTAPAGAPPPPELINITDDMSNDDKRAARIANAKAKSAYKKELKALGIDPKSVKI